MGKPVEILLNWWLDPGSGWNIIDPSDGEVYIELTPPFNRWIFKYYKHDWLCVPHLIDRAAELASFYPPEPPNPILEMQRNVESQGCTCGGTKARTPHSSWCDSRGGK